MTLAQLKKDAKSGTLKAEMTYRFGDNIPDRLKGVRDIVGANSVAIFFLNAEGNKSELRVQKASLVDYEKDRLTIYSPGSRALNDAEKNVMTEWEKIASTEEYKRRAMTDAYTDGSSTYWQQKRFFDEKGFGYLRGFEFEHGCKYDYNTGLITDMAIKGEKIIEYKIFRS